GDVVQLDESQHLYLCSERGDIFHGYVSTFPPTLSFSWIGQHASSAERIELLDGNESCSYLACYGAMCDGSIMMIRSRRQLLSLDPVTIVKNPPPILDLAVCPPLGLPETSSAIGTGLRGNTLLSCSRVGFGGLISKMDFGLSCATDSSFPMNGITGIWLLMLLDDEKAVAIIVVSFASDSRAWAVDDPILVDATDRVGILTSVETQNALCLTATTVIAQVFSDGISVSMCELDAESQPQSTCVTKWYLLPKLGEIVGSAELNSLLFLATSHNQLLVLNVLTDLSSSAITITLQAQIQLHAVVSCLYLSDPYSRFSEYALAMSNGRKFIPEPLCLVGFHDETIDAYTADSLAQENPQLVSRLRLSAGHSSQSNIPDSIHMYILDDQAFVLCGSRSGQLFSYPLYHGAAFGQPTCYWGISNTPVRILSHPLNRALMVLADQGPFLISQRRERLHFEPILTRPIRLATPLPIEQFPTAYLIFRDSCVEVIRLGKKMEKVTQSLSFDQIPTKLVYDGFTKKIIAVFRSEIGGSGTVSLRLLDPESGDYLAVKLLAEIQEIGCLELWFVKKRRYVCLGARTNTNQGKLFVFNIKATAKGLASTYKFYLLSELSFDSPVSAISPMGFYLVVSSGSLLYQLKINAETRKVIIGCKSSARTPSSAIKTTEDYDIYSANSLDSLCYFQLVREEKKMRLLASEKLPRECLDCW
ncbi:hypothetical protein HDU91_001104, partial [Kappamyces sp. JEL0680]